MSTGMASEKGSDPLHLGPLPVAVVIPAYNAERFIGEALDSVWAQTVRPAEVIVVDDGSIDRTAAVARSRGATVLTQPNMGVAAARNAAIRATVQPWIAFLDADDVWEPRKLEAQWAAIRACPDAGAVFTDFTEFDANGPIGGTFLSRKAHYWSIERTELAPGMVRCERESLCQQFLEGNFIAPSTTIARRALLLQVGLFDPALSHLEDRDCWLRLLAVSTMAVVERPLVWSRIHATNLTNDHLRANVAGILLTERILADTAKYPPTTAERYQAARSIWHLNAGRFAEEKGNLQQARQFYLRAWRFGGGLRALALAALSCLPDPVRSVARATRLRLLPSQRGARPGQQGAGVGPNLAESARRQERAPWSTEAPSPLRRLARLTAYVIRRRNQVVREADLTIPRAPTSWALGERAIEIGPENLDTVMTPDLLAFLGGDRARKSLDDVRRGNRLIVVSDAEGYAAYGHIVINSEKYVRVLGEQKAVPYLGNIFTTARARRRGLSEKIYNESQRVLWRLGYRRVLGEASPTNVGSMKGGERMGMRVIRHFTGWIICEALVIQRDILNGGPWQAVRR